MRAKEHLSRLRFRIAMSLDGYVAGPHQSVENPLGVGGLRLHEWVFPLRVWREMQGLEGGDVDESSKVVAESMANIGPTVMGRNMFGGHPGPWDPRKSWKGWWGPNPPYHHPVFVLTHHPREPLVLEGGTTFHFVTGGIEAALEQARRAAGGQDVSLAGGAKAAQQYLAAGLVDEMEIHLVPTLLGSGERLFDHLDGGPDDYECVELVSSPSVAHVRLRRHDESGQQPRPLAG